jgi:hypothetical protein
MDRREGFGIWRRGAGLVLGAALCAHGIADTVAADAHGAPLQSALTSPPSLGTNPLAQLGKYTFTVLDLPPFCLPFIRPTGINNRREITGLCDTTDPPVPGHPPPTQGFLIANGGVSMLAFPGSDVTLPFGINDHGDVVGEIVLPPPDGNIIHTIRRAFLYRHGQFSSLNDPEAPQDERALGIANDGTIVGLYFDDFGLSHGFTRKDGLFQTVDAPGADEGGLVGTNDVGGMIGNGSNDTSEFDFVVTRGQFTNVVLPDSLHQLRGINNQYVMVGDFQEQIPDPTRKGGLLPRNHGIVIANGQLIVVDAPFEGAHDTSLLGINDRGDIIGIFEVDFVGPPEDCGVNFPPPCIEFVIVPFVALAGGAGSN